MEKVKPIVALSTLIEINKDRIEGYKKASEITEERDLQKLFSEFKQTSLKCRQELISEISKLGGHATESTKASGKFFRTWMDVKSALTGEDRKAILSSCEYEVERADATYQTIPDDESEHLNPQQQSMINAQHKLLKTDQNSIKSMLGAHVEAS